MKRIYHDYRRWEDYKAGMWRKVSKDEAVKLLPVAIEFTGDHIKYGEAMIKVTKVWKYSCEHNLTDSSTNKKAWIGHAACSFEMNLPESVVRQAWGMLSNQQRIEANNQADLAIKLWIQRYTNKQSRQLEIKF